MQIRRLCFLAVCLIAGFGGLVYRLVDLQVLQHERFVEAGKDNTDRTFIRKAKRGDIRDIKGNLLATSKVVYNVVANPEALGTNYITVAKAISPILGIPISELAPAMEPRTRVRDDGSVSAVKYARLKQRVEAEDWEKIQRVMSSISFGVDEKALSGTQRAALQRIRRWGITSEPEERRFYPNQELAAHVLGYVGRHDWTNSSGIRQEGMVGKEGLEATLDTALTGVSGWRQTEVDVGRREVVLFREQDVPPRPGLNAILTIDAGIQHIVEGEIAAAAARHNPVSISAIVVRPRTGEIVAMATLPTFDPNDPGDAKPEERRNRIITDRAEPGSTFKIVVVSGGLNEGLVKLTDLIDCENGSFIYAGRSLRDDHAFGLLTVERIISKSSNIGSAKIGIMLGKQRLYDYVRAFGFGERTGIPLPGEVAGRVWPVKNWSGLSISRIPMGHEVDCTSLQMVMAMAAIANGGVLMRPMLVDSFVDESGEVVAKFRPQAARAAVTQETARKMVTALKTTVSTNGTGNKAKLVYYTAAGKTGTAQKLVNGQYVRNKHYSSFIGFFPADEPELCISVVIDEPDRRKGYYGSETAAPVFQKIAERSANYLAIPPEHIPDQTLAASAQPRASR